MPFLQKFAWFAVTKVFSAWIVLDIMLSTHLDNVGYDGILPEYDFIVGNNFFLIATINIFEELSDIQKYTSSIMCRVTLKLIPV